MNVPAVFAWGLFFAPGAAFTIATIIRLQVDGITLLGAGFLAVFVWAIGAFKPSFWAAEVPPTAYQEARRWDELNPTAHLSTLDRADGIGTRKDNA